MVMFRRESQKSVENVDQRPSGFVDRKTAIDNKEIIFKGHILIHWAA